MWSVDRARDVIKTLKDPLWERGYHIAIGGGVAWRGRSDKDLDLFVLPLFSMIDARQRVAPKDILVFLEAVLKAPSCPFSSSLGEDATDQDYLGWTVGQFNLPGDSRIDVFICPC